MPPLQAVPQSNGPSTRRSLEERSAEVMTPSIDEGEQHSSANCPAPLVLKGEGLMCASDGLVMH